MLAIITNTKLILKYANTTATEPPIIAENGLPVEFIIPGKIKADKAVKGINFKNLFKNLFLSLLFKKTKGSILGI